MGQDSSRHSRSTQTKNNDIHKYRSVVSPFTTDPYCFLTRYPNTKTTQTEDEYTVNQKYQLKTWCLEEKMMPLCAKCLTCKCIFDCSIITTEDIVVLFKLLRQTNDTFEQFKFLAQHIKLDPYRFRAQFYVRIKRQGNWVIRRTCLDTFRHIFRLSSLELSELVKRIGNYIKENRYIYEFINDSGSGDVSDYNHQGYIETYATVTKMQVRREMLDKWCSPNFQPNIEDLSFLESFGFSNCYCNSARTIRHYLFYCPRFELTRMELLHFSSLAEVFTNERNFVRYVQDFVLSVTDPQLEY